MRGERKIMTRMLKMVPTKEAMSPVPMARPPLPCFARGKPSRQVAAAEGVPGMLIMMAALRPPETAPMYTARRKATAFSRGMP
jgi:hypothetical protein